MCVFVTKWILRPILFLGSNKEVLKKQELDSNFIYHAAFQFFKKYYEHF